MYNFIYHLLPLKNIESGKFLLLLVFTLLPSLVQAGNFNRIILDTDISSDVDDAGAVAVLHALVEHGENEIVGMMVSSGDPWSGPCLDALNTSFGRPDIPIGEIKGQAVSHVSKYTRYIAEHYPNDLLGSQDIPEAFKLYRKLLADQPDGSVTVVSIGYLSNLSLLLKSGPDEFSPLDGVTLVKQKVAQFVCMGGEFPAGREWNIYQDAKSADYVLTHWPSPIVFSGFEIGKRIMTGRALRKAPQAHPLYKAYELYNNLDNRQSWDQTAILLIDNFENGFHKYWDFSPTGSVRIDQDGANTWNRKKDGLHNYMIWNKQTNQLANIIDELMLRSTNVLKY